MTADGQRAPEPADRIGEVRARVRRTRLRVGAAVSGVVALLVAAALAVPSLVLGGADRIAPAELPPLTSDSCPDWTYTPPLGGGPREPLPSGAVDAVLCEVWGHPFELLDYQVLRGGGDRLVAAINALEPYERLRLQCLEGDFSQLSLVLRYQDGATTTVLIDRMCGISWVEDGGLWFGSTLDEFGRLYHRQVAASTPDPDTTPAPECPATIGADRLDLESEAFGPEPETIERPIGWRERAPVPYQLVGAVWCRYQVGSDQARLATARPERGDLTDLRDALNTIRSVTDGAPECAWDSDRRVAVLDVLMIADAVGGTAEFWVYQYPAASGGPACRGVISDQVQVATAPALVDYLLERLGP